MHGGFTWHQNVQYERVKIMLTYTEVKGPNEGAQLTFINNSYYIIMPVYENVETGCYESQYNEDLIHVGLNLRMSNAFWFLLN